MVGVGYRKTQLISFDYLTHSNAIDVKLTGTALDVKLYLKIHLGVIEELFLVRLGFFNCL